MKSSVLLITAVLLGTTVSGQISNPLQLKGTTSGVKEGKVYLQKFENKMFFTIDSASIKDGRFSFATKVKLPELYGLTLEKSRNPLYIFLENKPVSVVLDSASYYRNSKVSGSKAQDIFTAYKENQREVKIDEFIKQNPSSIVSAYVLYRDFSYRLTAEQIRSNLNLLDPALQKTQYVSVLKELIPVLNRVGAGNKAIDFTANDPDGKPVKLSDHFGKYLLVDFWAGWCGPCRRENPHVVAAYNKYKDKGFDVLGVSLDKTKESWVKAIADDKLTWTHVSDLAFWNSAPAKLYGVRAIPANFLIDPTGVIIARNLRGKDLDEKLAELLGTSASVADEASRAVNTIERNR